ncbi:hypothetical protein OG21DRAFT_1489661 [Imleria badia]|nr:hypothetical protein OG21DRAFT_1489661 [Imleria badia]
MHTAQQMVDIIPSPTTTTTTCPESFVDNFEERLSSLQLYALPDVFQPSSTKCSKGALFAQLGWNHFLVVVHIRDLQSIITIPPASDPYNCLTLSIQKYYSSISPLISLLVILTAHAILTTEELGSQPFKTV